jgi:hypothetical protein
MVLPAMTAKFIFGALTSFIWFQKPIGEKNLRKNLRDFVDLLSNDGMMGSRNKQGEIQCPNFNNFLLVF